MQKGLMAGSLLAACVLTACGSEPEAASDPAATVAASVPPLSDYSARTIRLWAGSCALCHVDGNAFAPRVGNAEEWRPRLAKGADTLLRHTLEGFGDMPPLGYCMACESEDFLAMINFMTQGVTVEAAR